MNPRAHFVLLLGITGVGILAFFGLCFAPGWLLSYGMWYRADIIEVTSPDGKYVAAGCHICGGATVQNSTLIEIRPSAVQFKKETETLLSVDMTQPGDNPFGITWMDSDHLVVTYTAGQTYMKRPKWKNISIKYIPK